MSDELNAIESVLRRVEDTLETAKQGFEDLLDPARGRRMSGLRNLIVFGRSVTFVLQNLRSIVPKEFDLWYEPQKQSLKDEPLMKYFVAARNELEKQGKLSVSTSIYIKSLSTDDIGKFGPPPAGATAFFVGDQLGGSGWMVKLDDGTTEKYYVELPSSLGEVKQHFSNLTEAKAPELQGATVEDLCRRYIERLTLLVASARKQFIGVVPPKSSVRHFQHLRRGK